MSWSDDSRERVQVGLALVERLVRLMSAHPDKLRMSVDVGTALARVSFTAHPDDSRTLIGAGGRHLTQLKWLLSAMLDGTGMEGVIDEVSDIDENGERFFARRSGEWPRAQVESLLSDIARACYPDVRSVVRTRESGGKWRVDVLFEGEPRDRRGFAKAVGLLSLPVGRVRGVKLVVDAKVATRADIEDLMKKNELERVI